MEHLTLPRTIFGSLMIALALNGLQYARAAGQSAVADSAGSRPVTPASITVITGDTSLHPAPTSATPASASPATPAASSIADRLRAAGLNPSFAELYASAARATGAPWQLLAAVHHAETNQSGSTNRRSSAGAIGPMQFMPATFAHYAVDGDQNGLTDITDVDDAVYSAGRYLAANGAAAGRYSAALYQYNHSTSYVSQVLSLSRKLGLN